MKKRILFVDDEPLVLQGLQRSLRPMRHEWEMDFAEGGAQALERLDAAHYDVVVSDMVMPGMDGARLLGEVQNRAPRTIRLILSGHAEQQHAMKCVGIAHQYISKPCDPNVLKDILARVTSLELSGRSEAIRSLLPRLERLPSIPALYSEIVRLLNDPDVFMDEVGEVISRDIATTAQILKVVNSSFFGLPRKISEPMEAASYLGIDTVKALVLATGVFSQFAAISTKAFSVEALSKHCQEVGAAARIISQSEQATQSAVNEALVAGFLHDAGKLVLLANLPDQFHQASTLAIERGLQQMDAEREIFGSTHAEVAGYLFGLWGLPAPVVEAVMSHHTPLDSTAQTFSPLTAVHVADVLVWERVGGLVLRSRPLANLDHLTALGLTERLPVWRSAVNESFATPS